MHKYAILYNPGHNRVYFRQSMRMAASELAIASDRIGARLSGVENESIAGIDYLTFAADAALCGDEIKIISELSFTYALFELIDADALTVAGGTTVPNGAGPGAGVFYLAPIKKTSDCFIDESVSTILKYTGKTNEIFTRMLINAAFYSQGRTNGIKLLDPVAGKCTTLFEGLIRGFDVYGIEIGDKAATEAYHYLKKFLETEKYKHNSETLKISGPDKSFKSIKYAFEIAKTKDDQKEKNTRTVEIISGNSVNAGAYYKKNTFDLIVGDLPYGVQHGNVTNQKRASPTRNPAELLEACLPAWAGVLKPGGAMALSWNTHVLRRGDAAQICARHGLAVRDGASYQGFAHRVDQSIARDVIVAVKPCSKA